LWIKSCCKRKNCRKVSSLRQYGFILPCPTVMVYPGMTGWIWLFSPQQSSRRCCTYRSAALYSFCRSSDGNRRFLLMHAAPQEGDQCIPEWSAADHFLRNPREDSVCSNDALPFYLMGFREILATEHAGSSMVISLPFSETVQPSNFLITTFSGSSKVL